MERFDESKPLAPEEHLASTIMSDENQDAGIVLSSYNISDAFNPPSHIDDAGNVLPPFAISAASTPPPHVEESASAQLTSSPSAPPLSNSHPSSQPQKTQWNHSRDHRQAIVNHQEWLESHGESSPEPAADTKEDFRQRLQTIASHQSRDEGNREHQQATNCHDSINREPSTQPLPTTASAHPALVFSAGAEPQASRQMPSDVASHHLRVWHHASELPHQVLRLLQVLLRL